MILLASILPLEPFLLELKIAVGGLADSLPLWVAYFVIVENFLYLGTDYYPHFKSVASIIIVTMSLAELGLVVSIGTVLWHISTWGGLFNLCCFWIEERVPMLLLSCGKSSGCSRTPTSRVRKIYTQSSVTTQVQSLANIH